MPKATLTSQPVRPGCVAVLAQNCLQDLLKLAAGDVEGLPVRAAVLTSDRWRLWLGVLFVLSVCYGPTGVRGGRLPARVIVKAAKAQG